MKYAIAFSAVLLLLAGCAYFGGQGQPQQVGEKTYFGNNNCLFRDQGFDCGATRAYTENGYTYLDLKLTNRYGKPITIKRVACVYGNTEDAFRHAYQVQVGLVEGRDYQNQKLACVDSEGNPWPGYPEFRGNILVWFNYHDDLDMSVQHVAEASMLSS